VKLLPPVHGPMPVAARFVALALLLLAADPLHAAQPAPPPRLSELAWLEGYWRDEFGGALSEEIWTAPSGDSIVGVWRWSQDGKVRIFEILAIKAEESGLVLRLRHFDPKLIASEEKDRPLVWYLVRSAAREAVFEGKDSAGKGIIRLTYRRPDEDTLIAVLEKEGKPYEFRYRRVRPVAPGVDTPSALPEAGRARAGQ
jgi:hypothetical protein